MTELLKTPLHDNHLTLKAKMVPFAGWQMPVQYEGIISEHIHTRNQASIFDISHMGELIVSGKSACEELQKVLTHDPSSLSPGRCRYGFLLNHEGGILDDLILYCLDSQKYLLVVNAARTRADLTWLKEHMSKDVEIEDRSDITAKIDIQGPRSLEVLQQIIPGNWKIPYFSFAHAAYNDEQILVSRTGYTGELGFEIYLPHTVSPSLWEQFLTHDLVKPAGLGARDTLRLEIGYPLYGQDLDESHTPVEAGLENFVRSASEFIGKYKLNKVRRKLVPFSLEGKRSARHGDPIYLLKGKTRIGTVTSGSYAPSLGHAIGLGYVETAFASDPEFLIRGPRTSFTAKRTSLPFYKKGTARMILS